MTSMGCAPNRLTLTPVPPGPVPKTTSNRKSNPGHCERHGILVPGDGDDVGGGNNRPRDNSGHDPEREILPLLGIAQWISKAHHIDETDAGGGPEQQRQQHLIAGEPADAPNMCAATDITKKNSTANHNTSSPLRVCELQKRASPVNRGARAH